MVWNDALGSKWCRTPAKLGPGHQPKFFGIMLLGASGVRFAPIVNQRTPPVVLVQLIAIVLTPTLEVGVLALYWPRHQLKSFRIIALGSSGVVPTPGHHQDTSSMSANISSGRFYVVYKATVL